VNTVSDAAVAQIDELLTAVEPKIEESSRTGGSDWFRASDVEAREMRTRLLAAIDRLTPAGARYRRDADGLEGHDGYVVAQLAGVLRGLRADVAAGYMASVEELVHAAVFDDFLEMAAELASKGFHSPAAVLAGSVLEEHLRKLAAKHGIAIVDGKGRPRSVEVLGVDLVKTSTLSEPERKIVQAWYGQRTEAAHGRHENVISDQVGSMIPGIREFMIRHPA
jgi:hypothetical protein